MKNKGIVRYIILFFEGIIVGFGAIMPGISGGTLCVAFGMYRPIIEVLSHPKKSIKQYIGILIPFVLGGVVMIPSPCPPEGEPEMLASEQTEVSTATCGLQFASGD